MNIYIYRNSTHWIFDKRAHFYRKSLSSPLSTGSSNTKSIPKISSHWFFDNEIGVVSIYQGSLEILNPDTWGTSEGFKAYKKFFDPLLKHQILCTDLRFNRKIGQELMLINADVKTHVSRFSRVSKKSSQSSTSSDFTIERRSWGYTYDSVILRIHRYLKCFFLKGWL